MLLRPWGGWHLAFASCGHGVTVNGVATVLYNDLAPSTPRRLTVRTALTVLLLAAAPSRAEPVLVVRPEAFPTLVNPNCSHCVDEAKRRARDLRDDDPVLCWTRGYSEGGAIPVRFFLNPYRVISDSYGLFVYDPDAGYARGFAPSFRFRFHGWRNGVMVMKDTRDGTLYSCLSGRAFDGPRKGDRLAPVPTLSGTWGDWLARYPHAVAYHMFDKYRPTEISLRANPDSVRSRGRPDPRLGPEEVVLGVHVHGQVRAYPRTALAADGFAQDTVDGESVLVVWRGGTDSCAAYKPVAHQPRKWKGPQPNADGVSPPDLGVPLSSREEDPVRLTFQRAPEGGLSDAESNSVWDVAGRCVAGRYKGWTLEPVDAVRCKWFAWAAEYPDTTVFSRPASIEAEHSKPEPMVAGRAEFLRLLPKPYGTLQGVDPRAGTVTLLFDGEAVAKVWPVEPDAEVKVHGWWGRLEQFKPGDRVWAWLKLNRDKHPVSVVMLADALTEWDMHGRLQGNRGRRNPPAAAGLLEARRSEQQAWLRRRWAQEGLPGTLTFLHVFSGELELMLDHEAMRWARALRPADVVHILAQPPIKGVVKVVTPWRERTCVRLVVGELAAADLKVGQRLSLKVTAPAATVDEAPYPPDIDRSRDKSDRVEWFLCSTYCVCAVRPDICTGQMYTLASCNPNGCGAPNALRQEVAEMIEKGLTNRQIWDALLRERGPLMTRPHLLP